MIYYLQEYSKTHLNEQNSSVQPSRTVFRILLHCLNTSLLLMSPLMPFLSEELYQRLRTSIKHTESCDHNFSDCNTSVSSIMLTQYPMPQSVCIIYHIYYLINLFHE